MNLNDLNLPKSGDENNNIKKSYIGHGIQKKITVSLYEFTCGHESCGKINRQNMYATENDGIKKMDDEAFKLSGFKIVDNMYYCSYCAPFHMKKVDENTNDTDIDS